MKCPKCDNPDQLHRDEVDVGVGVIYGPYGCNCGWSEYPEYDQTKGNGGLKSDGSYTDPFGGYWPKNNPINLLLQERLNDPRF